MKNRNENGALIVEASIVFPVMFLVIFFMIYAGNAYLQKCRVESIVSELAIDGASYCADPQLDDVENGGVPSLENLEVYPYRFFSSTGSGDIESYITGRIDDRVDALGTGLFPGMKPQDFSVSTDYSNGILYATFAVDVDYKVKNPVRLLFEKDYFYMEVSTHVEMPVSDTTELIRNIDMIWDYMQKFGVDKKLEKIKEMVSEAKEWFNRE